MEWTTKRINDIENALKEVENANLTSETKIVVLNCLKDELNLLNVQKKSIIDNMNHVNGFKK